MREIKFKAINTKTKRLLSSDNLVYSDGKWYEDWRYFEDGIPLDSDYKIMQYAVSKDENGVEIYEGDIIQEDTESDELDLTGTVVFVDGAFKVQQKGFEPEYLLSEWKNVQVIGNIYEGEIE